MTTNDTNGTGMISALNVSIGTVEVSLGTVTQQFQLAPPIENYTGDRLHISRTVSDDGSTIRIVISDQVFADVPLQGPFPAVTALDLTVSYNGVSAQQNVPFAAPYDGAGLIVTLKLSADFTTGFLFVAEAATNFNEETAAKLGFVLVQESPLDGGDQALYRVNWLGGITIDAPERFREARIVPPAQQVGGITGPMGIATP